MLNRSVAWSGLLLAIAAPWPVLAQQATGATPPDTPPPSFTAESQSEALPAFRGELDVSLINLFVTVIDSEGASVAGLSRDDFEVFEDGAPVEVTNFEALGRRDLVPVEAAVDDVEETAVAPAEMPKGRYVALLFDNLSLERRNRKQVLASLEPFIDEGLARNDVFMIALNTGSARDREALHIQRPRAQGCAAWAGRYVGRR